MARFTVKGGGQFPISMLRFDRCWPISDVDAGKIADSFGNGVRWEVELETDNQFAPNVGRWDSFNCRVEQPT